MTAAHPELPVLIARARAVNLWRYMIASAATLKHALVPMALVCLILAPAMTSAQPRPAPATPTDVKPGSITCEDVPIRIRFRTSR